MSEDSSTFPRVTDICANQVAPFLSRSSVFEKLEKCKSEKVKTKPTTGFEAPCLFF